MRIIIADDNGSVFASHEIKDSELVDANYQTIKEFLGDEVEPDVMAYRVKKTRETEKKDPPKAGAQCEHGFHWYAETDSANPEFPVGSLSIDCTTCDDAVPLGLRANKKGA